MNRKPEIYAFFTFIGCIILPMVLMLTVVGIVHARAQVKQCEKCELLKERIDAVLEVIYQDNPNYYLDVLTETEEFYELNDLLTTIPDSTHKKLRSVFPDLPSQKPE